MSMYSLKYKLREIFTPFIKKILWINPDFLSYMATLVAFITMFCYIYVNKSPELLLIALLLTILRILLNTMDGVIAVNRGNTTLYGEIVNALPDRYSDIFILLGLALSPLGNITLGLLTVASVFLVSYTGMMAKAIGVNWQHQGPLSKGERMILIIIFMILQYMQLKGFLPNIYRFTYFEWLMILFIILAQITVFNRLKGQISEIKSLNK